MTLVCLLIQIHNQSNLTLKQIKFINLKHENQPTTKSNLPETQAILNKAISIQLGLSLPRVKKKFASSFFGISTEGFPPMYLSQSLCKIYIF